MIEPLNRRIKNSKRCTAVQDDTDKRQEEVLPKGQVAAPPDHLLPKRRKRESVLVELPKPSRDQSRDMALHQALSLIVLLSTCYGSPPCVDYGCQHPTPPPLHFLPAPPGKTPACAKNGKTYCEQIDNYPTQLIQHLIERWEFDLSTLFTSEDQVPNRPRPVYGPPNYKPAPPLFALPPFQPTATFPHHGFNTLIFNQTQGGYPDRRYPFVDHTSEFFNNGPEIYSPLIRPPFSAHDPWWKRYDPFTRKKRQSDSTTSLCPTFPQFVMPKAGLNNKGNWMYVVNLDTNRKYTQVVRTETCINPGRPCNSICSLPNGYSSRCEQQYVQKKLVALSGDGSDLHVENFWLPHCCLCQITQNNR